MSKGEDRLHHALPCAAHDVQEEDNAVGHVRELWAKCGDGYPPLLPQIERLRPASHPVLRLFRRLIAAGEEGEMAVVRALAARRHHCGAPSARPRHHLPAAGDARFLAGERWASARADPAFGIRNSPSTAKTRRLSHWTRY